MLDYKITIGIVARDSIKVHTVMSLCSLLKIIYPHELIIKNGGSLHGNRETIANRSVENGSSHLLFIDSDIMFDPNVVIEMIKRDKDIIGANYNHRTLPLVGTARGSSGQVDTEKCEAVATGLTLIKTNVFKKINHPFFFWKYNDKGEMTMAEDYWFCEKAKEAGFEIWTYNTSNVKHIGEYLY